MMVDQLCGFVEEGWWWGTYVSIAMSRGVVRREPGFHNDIVEVGRINIQDVAFFPVDAV